MSEIQLNVRVPATDRQFLLIARRDGYVKNLYANISQVHSKLFNASVRVSFVRNALGSVVDPDLSLEKVFQDGDLIEACCASVIDAFAGLSEEARASEKRAAEELDAVTHGGKKSKKQKKVKDPNAPKRPVNAFLHFVSSKRVSGVLDDKGKELMKKLGEEWKQMSENQKSPFVKMKDAQKAAYDAKMKQIADDDDGFHDDELSQKDKKTVMHLWDKHGASKKNVKMMLAEFNQINDTNKRSKWFKYQLKAMKLME